MELPDLSRLGYSYLGLLSNKTDEKQETIRRIRNFENDSESELTELENVDMENHDEMNKIFRKIIDKEQDKKNNADNPVIYISIEDYDSESTEGDLINDKVIFILFNWYNYLNLLLQIDQKIDEGNSKSEEKSYVEDQIINEENSKREEKSYVGDEKIVEEKVYVEIK